MKTFNFLVLILFLNTQVLAGEALDHDDFTSLSDDILLNITEYLDFKDLASFAELSHRFSQIEKELRPYFFTHYCGDSPTEADLETIRLIIERHGLPDSLDKLRVIDISNEDVSSLRPLHGLNKLQELYIYGTLVQPDEIRALR